MEGRVLLSSYALSNVGLFGTNSNGTTPQSMLVADAAGNLYGTATSGGAYGCGAVFEIAKGSNAITGLASIDGTNGSAPYGAVTLDGSGNLFGTAFAGGASNYGTVFEIAHGSNTITALASFDGTNGSRPSGNVTIDPSGNLYGTTQSGGANNDGTVFEVANGTAAITTLASFNGANGSVVFAGLTLDASGNLYGATEQGGAYNNNGSVFEIGQGSTAITTLVSFRGSEGLKPDGAPILDAAGNLYGTARAGGANGDGSVYEIARGSSIATALASFAGTNGSTPYAGLAVDASGNLYGTTQTGGAANDGTVFELALGSMAITTLASFNGVNGKSPFGGVMLDASGNLYGTTQFGGGPTDPGTVFEIANGSTMIIPVGSFAEDDGWVPLAGVMLDAFGNLYGTTDSGGADNVGTVLEIAPGTTTVTTLASFDSADGAHPYAGVTLDASGDLFGTTYAGGTGKVGTVWEIAVGSNTITTLASFNGTNGSEPEAAVTLDAAGNLYGTTTIGGANNDGTVFEIAQGSGTVTTLETFNGTNGRDPVAALTLDASGNLYGTTEFGGPGGADGTVFEIAHGTNALTTRASFQESNGAFPYGGVTLDAAGNLYGTTATGTGYATNGEVFEIPKGWNITETIADFDGVHGGGPEAGVTLDAAGNIFGTADSSTVSPYGGEVFEIPKGSHTLTTLASFDFPFGYGSVLPAGVTLDPHGNLYGMAHSGGPGHLGSVFELAANTAVALSISSGSNPADVSQPVTFAATVTGGVPDGETVNLLDLSNGSKIIASAALSGGSATLSVPAGTLSPGPHNLLAVYAGDANFAACESSVLDQVVQAAPSITAGPANASVPMGQPATFTATAGGYPVPSVRWQVSTDAGRTFADLPGATTTTLSFTAAESQNGYEYQAVFTSALGTATTAPATLTVTTPVTLAAAGPNPSNASQSLSFTATVSGGAADGEQVLLEDSGNGNRVVATGTLASGSAALTVPAGTLLAGTHNLVAVYPGDANLLPGQSSRYSQTVQVVVTGVAVNGNIAALAGVQRSMVDSIVYTFSEAVRLAPTNAFTIAVHPYETGVLPTLTWAALKANPDGSAPQWVVTFSGNGVVNNSIANGLYDITLNTSAVSAESNPSAPVAPRRTDTFYRLYGDINGDRHVNNADNFQFRLAQATYNPAFDYNGDGIVNNADNFQFRKSQVFGFFGDGIVTTI